MRTINGIAAANNDTFSTPIHLSDILTLCKQYSQLGFNIQHQVECITEMGIEEAVRSGTIDPIALPHIKDFLRSIADQGLWGDAASIALDCVCLIELYEDKHPPLSIAN